MPGVRILSRGWPNLPLISSVRGRIIAGFGLLVIILITVVAGSAWMERQYRSHLAEMQMSAATADLLGDALQNATLANLLLERYVITGNERVLPVIRSSMATVTDSLAEARSQEEMRGDQAVIGVDDEAELAALDEAAAGAALLAATSERVIALQQGGDMEGARQALEAAVPEITQFGIGIGAATELERQEVAALRSRADRTGDLALWLLVVSGAIGAVLGLAAAAFIARSVLKPLSSLESAALAVAGGDLEARASPTGPRELARLSKTLNLMTASLVKDIRERERTQQALWQANQELQQRNRQLLDARAQAVTDGLTGLSNHRAFQERVRDEVSRAQRNGNKLSLIMLDIDGFKRINDSLGHLAGDQILRELATTLAEVTRVEDAYRYGGDEFAVVLPAADRGKAVGVAERLRRDIAKRTDGSGEKITVSLGVTSFPETAASAEELIYGADAAMYWAKSAGKNRVGDWSDLVGDRADGALPWYAADRAVKAPDVVAALVAALAAKDPVTSAHTERCSWYTAKLAEELGLGEEETSVVRLASLLHDIGKLAVPDDVLCKPGPLNEEEWAQMKQHPTAALHVLGQIRSVADATPAILHHHEHFDGSGYPDGLAGDDIPIASRILLVTDAFDAMTTDRPYRKAMPIEAAIEELKRNGGTQFDPTIVEAFLRILARHGAQPLRRTAHASSEPVTAEQA